MYSYIEVANGEGGSLPHKDWTYYRILKISSEIF